MKFTKEEINELKSHKTSAVLVTELLEDLHLMCDKEIRDALSDIRKMIEAEHWANAIRLMNAKYELKKQKEDTNG